MGRVAAVKNVSPFYETPAWPDPADPPFVNVAARIETGLSPAALMAALHGIEAGCGRVRRAKNAPRTLDLDLIAYGAQCSDGADGGPVLPHPRLESRAFVLAPLCDIAPDWRHPGTGKTARSMLEALPARTARRIS